MKDLNSLIPMRKTAVDAVRVLESKGDLLWIKKFARWSIQNMLDIVRY
jgi:hypothetical protein